MLSSYRIEKKKITDSQKSETHTDDVDEPTLWCLYFLLFVNGQETSWSPVSSFVE